MVFVPKTGNKAITYLKHHTSIALSKRAWLLQLIARPLQYRSQIWPLTERERKQEECRLDQGNTPKS